MLSQSAKPPPLTHHVTAKKKLLLLMVSNHVNTLQINTRHNQIEQLVMFLVTLSNPGFIGLVLSNLTNVALLSL